MSYENNNRPAAGGSETAETLSDVEAQSNRYQQPAPRGSVGQQQVDFKVFGSRQSLARVVVNNFLKDFDLENEPEVIESALIRRLNDEVRAHNQQAKVTKNSERFLSFRTLPSNVVARVIATKYVLRCVRAARSAARPTLSIYVDSGSNEGIYISRPDLLRSVVRRFIADATKQEANDVLDILREDESLVSVVEACDDPDLIPVNNGIFDYRTKELLPFSPALVFSGKIRTDYRVCSTTRLGLNRAIPQPDGSAWDIETWVEDMSNGDPEWADAFWHVVGASVRPGVNWDKAVYLYDEEGESGKGTTLELLRGLHGDDSVSSLAIADFHASQRFRLAELEGKTLNACDENSVGYFNDDLAAYKAVITGDVVNFERKMEQPYSARVSVFMIQCLNGHTKSKDTSKSAQRRQYYLPFTKSYTGRANKAIKHDYVRRPEILEYVLWKVLTDLPNYYVLPETAAGRKLQEEARVYNDNVLQFWQEFEDQFVWDLLPAAFLYDLYKSWFARVNGHGKPLSQMEFSKRLKSILRTSTQWEFMDQPLRPGQMMAMPECLINDYGLSEWMAPGYTGSDLDKRCSPQPKALYRGVRRITGSAVVGDVATDEN